MIPLSHSLLSVSLCVSLKQAWLGDVLRFSSSCAAPREQQLVGASRRSEPMRAVGEHKFCYSIGGRSVIEDELRW